MRHVLQDEIRAALEEGLRRSGAGIIQPINESSFAVRFAPSFEVTVRIKPAPLLAVVASVGFTPEDIAHAPLIVNEWNRSMQYPGAAYVTSTGLVCFRYVHTFPYLSTCEDPASEVQHVAMNMSCCFMHFKNFSQAMNRPYQHREDV